MSPKKKSMTVVAELKAASKAKGLKVSGNKEELKKRLADGKKSVKMDNTTQLADSSKYLRNLLNERTITIASLKL